MTRAFVAALLGTLAQGALACGVCIEDRVAATYDHAVVTRAADAGHAVAFVGVEGTDPPAVVVRRARAATLGIAGIDRGSLRIASEPAPAMSFAFDPQRQSARSVLDAIEQKAAPAKVKLTLLRVYP